MQLHRYLAGQRRLRSDLSADWLVAVFAAIIHAAATEMDAGRLDAAQASSNITSTMLAMLGCQWAP